MSRNQHTSRRDFLAATAGTAAATMVVASGCAATGDGTSLKVVAGPPPRRFSRGDEIGVGFIGLGGRGMQLVGEVLKHGNASIKALAEPEKANADKAVEAIAAAGRGKPDVYSGETDYRDKLLARDDIHAVLIATPIHLHAQHYLDAFAAGKHFYGEKPMCIDVRHAGMLVEAQKRNPEVVAQIGFQRRATELYREGVKAIRAGMIGDPVCCYAAWNVHYGPLGLPEEGARVWLGRRRCSGDWMLEQASHTWDVLNWVAGDLPIAAWGKGRRDIWTDLDPQRDVTDFYLAHIEYPNGMLVDFEHCFFSPDPEHDTHHRFRDVFERFLGPKGGIALSKHECLSKYYPRTREGKSVVLATDTADRSDEHSVNAFFASIETGAAVVSTVENGRNATLVGLLVREGVDRAKRVEMKEILRRG